MEIYVFLGLIDIFQDKKLENPYHCYLTTKSKVINQKMLLLWMIYSPKKWFKNDKQQYKCYSYGKHFLGGERIDNSSLWNDYVHGKQTYEQLASKYKCSIRTIQRRLDKITVRQSNKLPRKIILLIDTTYWERGIFDVMLF